MKIFLLGGFIPQSWPGHWERLFPPRCLFPNDRHLHCIVILKVLSSLLDFFCPGLFEHKCENKHCDCKLDMTLPEEPAEGMESKWGMSVAVT